MAVDHRKRLLHRDIREEIRVYENLASCTNEFSVVYHSGLFLEQMVGFSLMHSLLGFLGCESWVRLN